ncbi:MAG: SBBP repeat-containing protein, partial [Actinobacteria bacterium]|nr:SBBP repeat-containing protein [Actinomycetota bacterium]
SLVYSTYLGSNTTAGIYSNTRGNGIAIDKACPSSCPAVLVGSTTAHDFPTTADTAYQATFHQKNASMTFLTKLTSDGSALVYSTYLSGTNGNGSNPEGAVSVSINNGVAYLTGQVASTDFPTTPNAYQERASATVYYPIYVAAIDPSQSKEKSLVYSTLFSGEKFRGVAAVAVDAGGSAVITGSAAEIPTTPGAYQTTRASGGQNTGFVTKFDSTGSHLLYSTYLGGSGGPDQGTAVALDRSGNAFVTGAANSGDFPTTAGAYQAQHPGQHAFLSKLNPAGTSLLYSTILGGSGADLARGVALDAGGVAYVLGNTSSSDFPTPNSLQPNGSKYAGNGDAFIAQIDPRGQGQKD